MDPHYFKQKVNMESPTETEKNDELLDSIKLIVCGKLF